MENLQVNGVMMGGVWRFRVGFLELFCIRWERWTDDFLGGLREMEVENYALEREFGDIKEVLIWRYWDGILDLNWEIGRF